MTLADYIILEDRVVKFGKQVGPHYGQCVILAGGAGSGKGYTTKHYFGTEFKIFDVDELKKMYLTFQSKGLIDDEHQYNLKNPDDTSALHYKVRDRGWRDKTRASLHRSLEQGFSELPNILFDIVCDDIKDIKEIIEYARPLGYYITVVWVLCNYDSAKENNDNRDRKVGIDVLNDSHTGARETMLDFFSNKYPDLTEGIDAAWYAFSTTEERPLTKEYLKTPVNEIKKSNPRTWNFKDKREIENFLDTQMPKEEE